MLSAGALRTSTPVFVSTIYAHWDSSIEPETCDFGIRLRAQSVGRSRASLIRMRTTEHKGPYIPGEISAMPSESSSCP